MLVNAVKQALGRSHKTVAPVVTEGRPCQKDVSV